MEQSMCRALSGLAVPSLSNCHFVLMSIRRSNKCLWLHRITNMASELIKNKLKGWTVLVVDDEPDSLFVAARWLKLAGATVLSAENGKDGLELARLMQPRFILTDLTMPVMDGWEFQYELRGDPSTKSIPVIALTAMR